jgi:hypothetical protein
VVEGVGKIGGPGRDRTDDLPGRAGARSAIVSVDEFLYRAMRLPPLQLLLATARLSQGFKFLLIHEYPRPAPTRRRSLAALMLLQSSGWIRCTSDIELAGALTLQNVNEMMRNLLDLDRNRN